MMHDEAFSISLQISPGSMTNQLPSSSVNSRGGNCCEMALKKPREDDVEEIQEVPGSLAAAKHISMDATVAVVLSQQDGIFIFSANNDAKYTAFLP